MTAPALINAETGEVVSDVEWSAVSLHLPETLAFDQWQSLGGRLQQMERAVMWWIGDWLRFGERRYGETYAQAVEATGYSVETLKQAKWLAGVCEPCDRSHKLSWTHHLAAAGLPAPVRAEVLAEAERAGWSVRELKAEIRQRKNRVGSTPSGETCTTADLSLLVERGDSFGCIYADPPWIYDNQSTRAATGNHYRGLTVDQLCELPVRDLAAPNAHLHLWTTNAFLFDCPRIFAAWGFEFRSTFVWCKTQMGIGNYWRNSHEFLLTGIRGDAKRFNDHSLRSWLECDRGRHSAKPERVREMLMKASPGPYLEMFARAPATDWTVWGNEIDRGLLFHDVAEVA